MNGVIPFQHIEPNAVVWLDIDEQGSRLDGKKVLRLN
jgi:hypothetical protein